MITEKNAGKGAADIMVENKVDGNIDYSVRFGMGEYFSRCGSLLSISGIVKTLSTPTPYMNSEGNTLAIVTSGGGKIIVNNETYKIKRGSFMCIGPFHSCTIVPDGNTNLKLAYCCMDCGIYMYMMSNPYVKVNTFVLPQGPIYAQVSEADCKRVENIFSFLIEHKDDDYFINKIKYMYVMELCGILLHESNKKILHGIETDTGELKD